MELEKRSGGAPRPGKGTKKGKRRSRLSKDVFHQAYGPQAVGRKDSKERVQKVRPSGR